MTDGHQSVERFESSEAATKHAITVSGQPIKAVALALWPDKTPEAAATALRNALNEDRSERLTADQHLFLACHLGQFHWLYYAAERCSHSKPTPIQPADMHARLEQQLMLLITQVGRLQGEMQRIQGVAPATPPTPTGNRRP